MKLSDEELSRVLSAHAGNQLRQKGSYDEGQCCLLSSAIPAERLDVFNGWDWAAWDARVEKGNAVPLVDWFDETYNPGWPIGRLVRELEKQGLV